MEAQKTTVQEEKKKSIKWHRDKDRQKVKGIFKFYEVPGGTMSFVFKKYKEDPIERYDMTDGQIYEVPLAVAKHLNKNVSYPIHGYITDEQGNPKQSIAQRVQRCGFQSLEFIDEDDIGQAQGIITVTSL